MNAARRALGRTTVAAYRAGIRARGKTFSLLCAGSFASYGANTVLEPPIRLVGERRIAIGRGVYIGAGSWLQVLGPPAGDPAIVIGDGTSIAGTCVISAAASVELGPNVLLARNVYVSDHSHAFDDTTRAILDQGIDRVAAVCIGEGAWLGQNVAVGPGVTIGAGAVIGANAVVLDDVPPHAVAVGAPARVVRSFEPAAAQ